MLKMHKDVITIHLLPEESNKVTDILRNYWNGKLTYQ
jgi:hypothetical protein